jgi:hypothetical protein
MLFVDNNFKDIMLKRNGQQLFPNRQNGSLHQERISQDFRLRAERDALPDVGGAKGDILDLLIF